MTAAAGPAEQTSKACLKVTNWLESRSPWSQTHARPLTHNRRSEPTKAPENEEWIREGGAIFLCGQGPPSKGAGVPEDGKSRGFVLLLGGQSWATLSGPSRSTKLSRFTGKASRGYQ